MLTYRAARMSIALDELQRAYPAVFEARTGERYKLLLAFVYSFGLTHEIEFNLNDESPDDLVTFQEWWTRILPKGDYRAAFESYIALVSREVMDAWAEAVEATRAPSPAAPAELQPGAAERAEHEPDFTPAVSE
jgi:hypothetical protein